MQVLGLACEERALRVDLGARILGLRPSALVPIVSRLQRLGLVEQERFLVSERYAWFWPTRSGLRLDGRGYPFYVPAVGQLRHMAGVAATRAVCLASDPQAVWVPERALVREQGRCKWHLADAALDHGGARTAIEVELSGKDRYRVIANMAALERDFDGGRYYCDGAVRSGVLDAVARGGFSRIEVLDAPAFV